MVYYNIIKALHIIFVISWFAALFYMPRLLIYHIEAQEKPKEAKKILSEQLQLMQRRLWNIISWPSAILATVFAIWLLYLNHWLWLSQPWMLVKLIFVGLLWLYHIRTHYIFKNHQKNKIQYSSRYMRIWNEVATILLFAIVFLASLKNTTYWIYGVGGIILLGVFLMIGIKGYKKYRDKNPNI